MNQDSHLALADTEILNALSFLISKHSNIKKKLLANEVFVPGQEKRLNKSSSSSILESLSTDSESSISHSFELRQRKSATSRSRASSVAKKSPKISVYSIDQYYTIDTVFSSLVEKYMGTSWIKLADNGPEIHKTAIRQFFLDCYVCDQNFMNLVFHPLISKEWINLDDFTKSIEGASKITSFGLFSLNLLKSAEKSKKRSYKFARMCCKKYLVYFRFVEHEAGNGLGRDSLYRVLDMADKRARPQLEMWVDMLMKKASQIRGYHKEKISFNEFKNLMSDGVL